MVAVPYSKGCRACVQRRVKCDESRPRCQHCVRRGVDCPGYQKHLKFLPVNTPSLHKIHHQDDQNQKSKKPRQPVAKPPAHKNNADELIAPSLVKKAFATQGVETLEFFIDATVPGLYYTYSNRVTENWMAFSRRNVESTLDPLLWSIRCLGILHLGKKNHDPHQIANSRAMYGRALHGLYYLLKNPKSARSDSTLAIAVMLGVYEMLDGVTPQSWLTHSSGIATIIRLRGPEAHRSGFGRTLLVSFKSFIVADALMRSEPCFLAEPAWRAVLSAAIQEDEAAGKASWLGNLAERIFIEVAQCPGLYARARGVVVARVHGAEDVDDAMRRGLMHEAVLCKGRLRRLKEELETGPVGENAALEPVDPIPFPVAQKLRWHVLHGSLSGMALLDQIVVLVQSDRLRKVNSLEGAAFKTWDVGAPVMTMNGESRLSNGLPVWPDQLALSMGMLAVKGISPASDDEDAEDAE
ncbi:hypothetical protein FE257_002807 [Aspergillus nanangensis]|uniref:Zn(2)-C6 fungal-type domain-containing protein n=1 Tax=Aspergillus nanangensis TaxID=2582783 RepID=A0AAD4CCI8_ASPNN|nr:hypothetical protein FE257_002807 [Aspergillus nanangensis]